MSSAGQNLAAISAAIDKHNAECSFPAVEVRMCDFEVERLGWDSIRGLPIVPDPGLGSGRFRIVCATEKDPGLVITEAVSEPVKVAA